MSPLEDLSVYFDDDGEDAELDGYPVRVLYGAPGGVSLQGVGMSNDRPRALVALASIPPRATSPDAEPVLEFAVDRADRSPRMRVTQIIPDGTGMATLMLAAMPD